MKKILITVALTGMILSGCGIDSDISDKMKSPSYPENNSTTLGNAKEQDKKTDENDEKVFEDFIKLVSTGTKPFELITYIEKEIGNVAEATADEMILALEEIQEMHESYYQHKFFKSDYQNALFKASKEGLSIGIADNIEDESLKTLIKEIYNSGYKLISVEGSVYPIVDYSFLKKYSGAISQMVEDYIGIMAVESDEAAARDAALVISWDELAQRILNIEKYTSTYTDFTRIEKIKNLYYNYMMMYLGGLNNTPAYDYQTKVYKDEVLESFNNLISNNMDSKSSEIVKEYLNIIKKSNYTITEEAKEYTSKLYEENISPEGKYSDTIDYKYVNNTLARLLPEKAGYKWIYNGFAEYGHQMTLEDIIKDDNQVKYIIKGKVDDMSDGESGKGKDYFEIDIAYTIKNAAIVQTKSENIMMDSDFNSIELIKAPLIQGNKWMQITVDKSGNYRYLNCEITDINEVGGSKVYTVEYRDQVSDYYEVRMIEEGIGVVSFTKLWESQDGSFEIGYSLYKEMSGY